MIEPDAGSPTPERSRRALEAAADVARRRAAGENISDQSVLAAHPDLLPELAEFLRKASEISDAVADAKLERWVTDHADSWSEATSDYQADIAAPGDVGQPPARMGRYDVQGIIDRGSFGVVYRAEDPELGRSVAIKLPRRDRLGSEEAVASFLQEARTAAGLRHPGIVAIHDVSRNDAGDVFVVMELIEGTTLREAMRHGRIPPGRAAELLAQVAEAVHYAHRNGLVHRDLKPANILLDSAGQPRVVDFGLAIHESEQRRRAGETSGTPAYMAPEQVAGEAHRLDGRADIWSLGVILYEMLCGRKPFHGETPAEIFDEILHREPKPPRQIDDAAPEPLERIALKCLRKPIADRYATANDLAADLRAFSSGTSRSRGGRWPLAAALVVGLLLAGAVWKYHSQEPPNAEPQASASSSTDNSTSAVSAAPAPLECTIDVLIWDPQNPSRRGARLNIPGALPVRSGDQIRVEATANQPAYLYLIWIDADGTCTPVYPWAPGHWDAPPTPERPVARLSLPEELDQAWPMQGSSGMETLLLLARKAPWPTGIKLQALLTDLPRQRMQNALSVVWFADGALVTQVADATRAPNFFDPDRVDDPVLQTQQLIRQRLAPYCDTIRAVSFAHADRN